MSCKKYYLIRYCVPFVRGKKKTRQLFSLAVLGKSENSVEMNKLNMKGYENILDYKRSNLKL